VQKGDHSAGLGADADVPLSTEQIAWANIIFVMESSCTNPEWKAHAGEEY
jgi:predicted protein tyrosine phosphatase